MKIVKILFCCGIAMFSGFAFADTDQVQICAYDTNGSPVAIEAADVVQTPGDIQVVSKPQSGPNNPGCFLLTFAASNPKYTLNWVKNQLANQGVSWLQRNWEDSKQTDEDPQSLDHAVQLNLQLYFQNGSQMTCNNVILGIQDKHDDIWVFSNMENPEKHSGSTYLNYGSSSYIAAYSKQKDNVNTKDTVGIHFQIGQIGGNGGVTE